MFVCVCNAITENDICSAVAGGCKSLRELREQLDFGSTCGRCQGCARDVLKNTLHNHAPHRPATAGQLAAA